LANRSVVLYLRTKIKKKWAYRKVGDVISEPACGEYYLSWNDGKCKRLEAAGSDPKQVLKALGKKRLELAYVAEGGEVKQPDKKKILETAYLAVGGKIQQPADKSPDLPEVAAIGEIKQSDSQSITQSGKKTVSKAVKEYWKDCDDRKGRSGYGLASRTPETYEYRLGFLIEFRPEASLEEVDVYLIFDRGSSFNAEMIDVVRSFGIQPKRTSFRSPWQNGVAERWVGTVVWIFSTI
jgi:hypothetical protein